MIAPIIVAVYLIGAVATGRVVADALYRTQKRQWDERHSGVCFTSQHPAPPIQPDWFDIVVWSVLGAAVWPVSLIGLGGTMLVLRHKRLFLPTLAEEERAERARVRRAERAELLRESAKMLDDPQLRRTLIDAADELEKKDG